jgi:ArsR family transcriptional regulator, arsenate/arsenite/antimonite-responsive transcriptional repressor
MHDTAALFRALADETRLQMMYLIRQHRELCVCDLENVLDIGQSKASRHLRYLLHAGLVEDRREAVWIYYRIAEDLGPAQLAVLDAVPKLLDTNQMAELEQRLITWRKQICGTSRGKVVCTSQAEEIHHG